MKILKLFILLSLFTPMTTQSKMQNKYHVYLPIVLKSEPVPPPKTTACRYAHGGISWLHHGRTDQLLALCGTSYYHSGSYRKNIVLGTPPGIPILWSNKPRYDDQAQDLADWGYTGDVLALNEPERTEQANMTPEESAEKILFWRNILPNNRFIVLNSWLWAGDKGGMEEPLPVDEQTPYTQKPDGYLQEFIDEYKLQSKQLPDDVVIGIHLYWRRTFVYRPGRANARIEQVCNVLRWNRIDECRVSVTEFSVCEPGADERLRTFQLTREIAENPHVVSFYYFTNYWTGFCETALYHPDSNILTEKGLGFKEAMQTQLATPVPAIDSLLPSEPYTGTQQNLTDVMTITPTFIIAVVTLIVIISIGSITLWWTKIMGSDSQSGDE